MALEEVFADGISSVRIIGETVRIEFASLSGGVHEGHATAAPRVRIVAPRSALPAMVRTLQQALDKLNAGA